MLLNTFISPRTSAFFGWQVAALRAVLTGGMEGASGRWARKLAADFVAAGGDIQMILGVDPASGFLPHGQGLVSIPRPVCVGIAKRRKAAAAQCQAGHTPPHGMDRVRTHTIQFSMESTPPSLSLLASLPVRRYANSLQREKRRWRCCRNRSMVWAATTLPPLLVARL